MMFEERPVVFRCRGARLLGILSVPETPRTVGVVIIVGGPQYRVGSHRQFVQLARRLAACGYSTMRFDHTGMGDSEGKQRSFDQLSGDIRAAIDTHLAQVPEATAVALWGLCDGASAAAIYPADDPRICGLALVNPWVRDEITEAKTRLKHYYGARVRQAAFWKKLLAGRVNISGALGGIVSAALRTTRNSASDETAPTQRPFQTRMLASLQQFKGDVLLVLSGVDLVAREFDELSRQEAAWREALSAPRVERIEFAEADHTFSRRIWKVALEDALIHWLDSLNRAR